MLNKLKERLADCKQFKLDEQRSANPSKLYIEDLDGTIADLERQITSYEYAASNPEPVIVGRMND